MLLLGGPTRARLRQRSSAVGRRIAASACVILVVALAVALVRSDRLGDDVALEFAAVERLADLPEYGERGTDVLGYRHDARLQVTLPVRNDGPAPVAVRDIDPFPARLGMLTVEALHVDGEPFERLWLWPGQARDVEVTARFDHCEYYTERAVNAFDAATVTVATLGVARTEQITFDHELVVRAPTILACPDRVMDRSAKQRSEDASIRG